MKKISVGKIVTVSILSILATLVLWTISGYNGLVKKQEAVTQQRSNIETQLQRRLDLIPNLVNTVKGYTDHEAEVMKQVSDARARLAGAKDMQEKAAADSEVSGALSRLLVVAENYPDLKASQEFVQLSDELAGTENRIAVARKDYNASAQDYNKSIKTFPNVIVSNMFGFSTVEYFQAQEGAQNAPKVEF